MNWQILDWATIACTIALLGFGIWIATGPERQGRPGSRRNGVLLILCAIPGLAFRLPHALGWPQSVQLAFDIPAVVLLIATGFFLVTPFKGPQRSTQQKR